MQNPNEILYPAYNEDPPFNEDEYFGRDYDEDDDCDETEQEHNRLIAHISTLIKGWGV